MRGTAADPAHYGASLEEGPALEEGASLEEGPALYDPFDPNEDGCVDVVLAPRTRRDDCLEGRRLDGQADSERLAYRSSNLERQTGQQK